MTSPSLGSTTETKAKLADLIQRHFNEQVVVSSFENISQVAELGGHIGVNRGNHFVIRCTDGQAFGVKLPARGVPFGLGKEKLLADLAVLLQAPNACPVEQTQEIDFVSHFAGLVVNITKWLHSAKPFAAIEADIRQLLQDDANAEAFLTQFGEWMAFGLLFGVRDRHQGNWVWANGSQKMAMIDLEAAIETGMIAEFTWILSYLDQDGIRREKLAHLNIKHLLAGVNFMLSKYQAAQAEIAQLLDGYDFSRGYQSSYSAKTAQEIVKELTSALN